MKTTKGKDEIYTPISCLQFSTGSKMRSSNQVMIFLPSQPHVFKPRVQVHHHGTWHMLASTSTRLQKEPVLEMVVRKRCIESDGLATCIEQMWLCGNVSIKMLDCNILAARDGCKSLRDRSSYQAFLKELTERFIHSPDVLLWKDVLLYKFLLLI